MVTRREMLVQTTALGGVTVVAGCSGESPENGSQTQERSGESEESTEATEDTEATEETTEETNEIAPEIFVENTSFSYTFSTGLASVVEVINNGEQGSDPVEVNISMVANGSEGELGKDGQWQSVEATAGQSEYDETEDIQYDRFAIEFDLEIGDVSETSEYSIDDVTDVQIRGRVQDEEYVLVETISGPELRERVDN